MAYSTQEYTGNGTLHTFQIAFPFVKPDDIKVTVGAKPAAYTWSNSSTIHITTAPASKAVVYIERITERGSKLVDFVDGSIFSEEDLDLSFMQAFYVMQETLDLLTTTVKLDIDGKMDAQGRVIKRLAAATKADEAVNKGQLDIEYPKIEIVSDNMDDVNVLVDNMGDINTVEDNITVVNTVAKSILKVDNVSDNMGDVDTLVKHMGDINTVEDSIKHVETVSKHILKVDNVSDNMGDVDTLVKHMGDINTVENSIKHVETVSEHIRKVDEVSDNIKDVAVVAANKTNVDTVAKGIGLITTVANDLNETISEIETVANDLNESLSEIETVAKSIANVDKVGSDITNVNHVGTHISELNTWLDMFNIGTAFPLSPARGMVFYRTDTKSLWIYASPDWRALAQFEKASLDSYEFNATAGQTVFTGKDKDGFPLEMPELSTTFVYLNGVLLAATDYTFASTEKIVLKSGAAVSDTLIVHSFNKLEILEITKAVNSCNNNAILSVNEALKSAAAAAGSKKDAEVSAWYAWASEKSAKESETSASESKVSATTSRTAKATAIAAKVAAEVSASSSASSASSSASSATGSASSAATATTKAVASATSAAKSKTSEGNALSSAATATAKAGASATSAANSNTSEGNALSSADAAKGRAASATSSAVSATQQATIATVQAASASISATAAAASAKSAAVSRTKKEHTTWAGATTFNTGATYQVSGLDVYMNGVLLASSDYTASNGTSSVTLKAGTSSNDILTTIVWS